MKNKNKKQTIGFEAVIGASKSFKSKNHNIKDMHDNSKLSLVLMKQTDLDNITTICQPVADDSEFQVHYRALVLRIKNDANEFILTVPTVFYNFKQEVAASSVDYHLTDIDTVANVVKDISIEKCKTILSLPIFTAIKSLGFDIQTYESNCGSIHRHPGRFGFSSIDLNKDPSAPGVVYRNKDAKDYVQSDSIIYISSKKSTELFLTETRIIDIQTDNAFTKGTYTEIPTVTAVAGISSSSQKFDALLGTMMSNIDAGYTFVGNASYTKHMLVQELLKAYLEFDFNADTSHVIANNITQAITYRHTFSAANRNIQNNSSSKLSKKEKSSYYERVWGWYDENMMSEIMDDPFYYDEQNTSLSQL